MHTLPDPDLTTMVRKGGAWITTDYYAKEKVRAMLMVHDLLGVDQRLDTARLDFVVAERVSWYPGRGQNGNGIMCWGEKRHETQAPTLREAIDLAERGVFTEREGG